MYNSCYQLQQPEDHSTQLGSPISKEHCRKHINITETMLTLKGRELWLADPTSYNWSSFGVIFLLKVTSFGKVLTRKMFPHEDACITKHRRPGKMLCFAKQSNQSRSETISKNSGHGHSKMLNFTLMARPPLPYLWYFQEAFLDGISFNESNCLQ